MKKLVWFIALSVMLLTAKARKNDVIKITGTKFPFDIMQQWIDEYTKTHIGVQFELNKAISADSADLQIAAHSFREGELKEREQIISVNRYIQLPIVNGKRKDLKALQSKGFIKKDLQDIYFSDQKKDDFAHPVSGSGG